MLDDDRDPTAAEHRNTEDLTNRDVVVVQEVVERRDLHTVQDVVVIQGAVQDRATIEYVVPAEDRAVVQHVVQRSQVIERVSDVDQPDLVLFQGTVKSYQGIDEACGALRLSCRWWRCCRWGNE